MGEQTQEITSHTSDAGNGGEGEKSKTSGKYGTFSGVFTLFGLAEDIDFDFFREMVKTTKLTCIFAKDSGEEDILA